MEVVGWVALAFFGLIGVAIAGYAVFEYFAILFKTFSAKVESQMSVRKSHYDAQAELKKARLARKREVMDRIANKKLDIQLGKMQERAGDKLGVEFEPVEAKVEQKVEPKEKVKSKEQKKAKESYPVNEQLEQINEDPAVNQTEEQPGYLNLSNKKNMRTEPEVEPEVETLSEPVSEESGANEEDRHSTVADGLEFEDVEDKPSRGFGVLSMDQLRKAMDAENE